MHVISLYEIVLTSSSSLSKNEKCRILPSNKIFKKTNINASVNVLQWTYNKCSFSPIFSEKNRKDEHFILLNYILFTEK